MLGLSFSEIIILAVIALVVIGPKQLPEVARNLGRFLNELKRTSNAFTREFRDNMNQVKVDPIKFEDPKAPAIAQDEVNTIAPESIVTHETVTSATLDPHIKKETDSHD